MGKIIGKKTKINKTDIQDQGTKSNLAYQFPLPHVDYLKGWSNLI